MFEACLCQLSLFNVFVWSDYWLAISLAIQVDYAIMLLSLFFNKRLWNKMREQLFVKAFLLTINRSTKRNVFWNRCWYVLSIQRVMLPRRSFLVGSFFFVIGSCSDASVLLFFAIEFVLATAFVIDYCFLLAQLVNPYHICLVPSISFLGFCVKFPFFNVYSYLNVDFIIFIALLTIMRYLILLLLFLLVSCILCV